MDVLFVGYDNIVSVAVGNTAFSELTFQVNNGEITPLEKNKFKIVPEKTGVLKFTILKNGQNIGEHFFRVKSLPLPEISCYVPRFFSKGGCHQGRHGATENEFIALLEIFDRDVKCDILGFYLTITSQGMLVKDTFNKSGVFSSETKEAIKNANIGDTFYFDEIKCRCKKDKNVRHLNNLVFTIKH